MVDCSGFIQPLNLECLFINTFAETTFLFVIIAMVMIAVASAFFRMTGMVVLSMCAIFILFLANRLPALYFLVVLIIAFIKMEYV